MTPLGMTGANPSRQIDQQLQALGGLLKQAAQEDPNSLQIDMAQAQQVRDALANIIAARQQAMQGKKAQAAAASAEASSGEDDDTQKKSSRW